MAAGADRATSTPCVTTAQADLAGARRGAHGDARRRPRRRPCARHQPRRARLLRRPLRVRGPRLVLPSTSTLTEASPGELEELGDAIEAAGVPAIFTETLGAPRTPRPSPTASASRSSSSTATPSASRARAPTPTTACCAPTPPPSLRPSPPPAPGVSRETRADDLADRPVGVVDRAVPRQPGDGQRAVGGAADGGVHVARRTWVVLRGMSFLGDALSHGVLPGIAIAFVIGADTTLGAFVAAIVMVAGVNVVRAASPLPTTPRSASCSSGSSPSPSSSCRASAAATPATSPASCSVDHRRRRHRPPAPGDRHRDHGRRGRRALPGPARRDVRRASGPPARPAPPADPRGPARALALAIVASFGTVGNLLVFAFLIAPPATATLLVRRVPAIMVVGVLGAASGGRAVDQLPPRHGRWGDDGAVLRHVFFSALSPGR